MKEKNNPNDKFSKIQMREFAKLIDSVTPKGTGFALLLFPLETEEPTNRLQYISNANRADMIRAMEGQIENLKRGN